MSRGAVIEFAAFPTRHVPDRPLAGVADQAEFHARAAIAASLEFPVDPWPDDPLPG
jgi:hypothetical protein